MTLVHEESPVVLVPTGTLPSAPKRPPTPREPLQWRPRVRKALLVALLALAVFAAYDRLIAPAIYTQRQQHLAGSFKALTPAIRPNEASAVLQIEKAKLNVIVTEGATIDNLRGGPVRVADSALPGDPGVMVVLGHRRAYGGPFADLGSLVEGDSIVVQARNGPIVDYRVQRVDRKTLLGTLEFEDSEKLSYLVLVTSEPGWLSSEQTIVVARALPINDVPALLPDLDGGVRRAAPFGVEALLMNAGLAASVLSWHFLKRRCSRPVAVMVLAPVVAFSVVRGIALLDTVLPFTR
jgi:LPXTG-site transpeptidase (sortase) family protein